MPTGPCLGMSLFPAWEHLQVPCLGHLPVPCLGTLASSLHGNACQCLAWARYAVPAWDGLRNPCLGTFANALPAQVCKSLPETLATSLPWKAFAGMLSLTGLFSCGYQTSMRRDLLRLFKLIYHEPPCPVILFLK